MINTTTEQSTKKKVTKIMWFDETQQQLNYRKTVITFEVMREYEIVQRPGKDETKKLINETPNEINRDVSEENFALSEISQEDISIYRRSNIPSFLLKTNGKYYYTTISSNLNRLLQDKSLMSTMYPHPHMCGECDRLSAASDENGGCAKVRDYHYSYIEKYDWITEGYETFNVSSSSFVVSKCYHYTPYPPRIKKTREEIDNLKLGLAQFLWDDVESITEVRLRKNKNKHQ